MKFIFLGPQGSGKSTQAKLLAQKMNMPYIEMGEELRKRAEIDDNLGSQIKSALQTGQLVKDQITIELLLSIIKKPEYTKGYILDGYPRNLIQIKALAPDINIAFYVNVSDEEAIDRLEKRKRPDDTPEALSKRLEIYHLETEPLLSDFKNKGILQEIDGQRPIEEIHEDIMAKVQNLI